MECIKDKIDLGAKILLLICCTFQTGTGIVTRDELSAFYSSVLGLDAVKVGEILDHAYQAMTSVNIQ